MNSIFGGWPIQDFRVIQTGEFILSRLVVWANPIFGNTLCGVYDSLIIQNKQNKQNKTKQYE